MDEQSEVIAFLNSPAAYAEGPATVERLETHGALVFLAGHHAFKIKRAVRYPYMDFSTLERRHAAIEREFEVNRTHSPQIYIGVVPVTRDVNGGLAIGGQGSVVEWAVHMRRFDQADLLSAVATRGALDADLARKLADRILDSHRLAPPLAVADADARIRRIVMDLAEGLAQADDVLPPFCHDTFRDTALLQLDRAAPCLRARGLSGFVARCHGDLHLNNIVLLNGMPTLFDAIEFDESLATIDKLYDLAFLLMDLDHRGLRSAANIVLNRYMTSSADRAAIDGLAALPLFLGMRSAVRAMVTLERGLMQPDRSEARRQDFDTARSNLEDAMRYLSPAPARLVAVGGLSGSGKSTLAAALSPLLQPPPGALHIRTDVERKLHFGVEETERLPAASYTRGNSDLIYSIVLEKAHAALAAGQSVVVDAVFAEAVERDAIEAVATAAGVEFVGLWLTAPRDILLARVTARQRDASDATADVVESQLQRHTKRVDWHHVDASGLAATALAAAVQHLTPQMPT